MAMTKPRVSRITVNRNEVDKTSACIVYFVSVPVSPRSFMAVTNCQLAQLIPCTLSLSITVALIGERNQFIRGVSLKFFPRTNDYLGAVNKVLLIATVSDYEALSSPTWLLNASGEFRTSGLA